MAFRAFQSTLSARLFARLLETFFLLSIVWLAPGHRLLAQAKGSVHFTSSQRALPMIAQNPSGIAVDQNGNVFVADQATGTVTEDKLSAGAYTSKVVVTGLKSPTAIAVDLRGNLYITEDARYQNGPTDVVKESLTFKNPGQEYTGTVIPTLGLGSPAAIALDAHGVIYVADSLNNKIIRLTLSEGGYVQTTLPTVALLQPSGVAVDADGSVYIADAGHARVIKEVVSGGGYAESTVTSTEFSLDYSAIGVAVDSLKNVYVLADAGYSGTLVFKETADGTAYQEAAFLLASIMSPGAIAADSHGFFYAAGPGENQLTKISTGAGDAGAGILFTTLLPISLVFTSDPEGATFGSVSIKSQGTSLPRFQDAGTGSCDLYGDVIEVGGQSCSVDVIFQPDNAGILGGVVTLNDPAGDPLGSGYVYGTGVAPSLQFPAMETTLAGVYAHPTGVATNTFYNLYFIESGTGTVWAASPAYHGGFYTGAVVTGLASPMAVAVGPAGEIYVATANAIYQELLTGTEYSGDYVQTQVMSGLDHLIGVAVDGSANLYLIASSIGDVRKEVPSGKRGYREISLGYGIANPSGLAADILGNVYVTDARQGVLYKETIQPDGSYQQDVVATGLDSPQGVTVDAVGNIYVAIPAAGAVYEYALQADGSYLPMMGPAGMPMAWGVAVDQSGDLYVTQNRADGSVFVATVTNPPTLQFANTRVGSLSADSPKPFTLKNAGNAPLIFEDDGLGANPVVPPGFELSNESSCVARGGALPQGQACTYAFDFQPEARKVYAGNAILSDNDFDGYYFHYDAQQMIPLVGRGVTVDATRTTMRISPDPVKAGVSVTISIAVTDTTVSSVIPDGDVTVSDAVGSTTTTLNGGSPVTLSQGKARFTATLSSPGTHAITAHYNGTGKNFSGSTFTATVTLQP